MERMNIKKILFYIYLSFFIHIFLFNIYLNIDKYYTENIYQKFEKKIMKIENIILETHKETEKPTEKAAISDKNNISSGRKSNLEYYNYININKNKEIKKNELDIKKEIEKKEDEKIQDIFNNRAEENNKNNENNDKEDIIDKLVDKATTLYEIDEPIDVIMMNEGDFSIATIKDEGLATYLLELKKKIEYNWRQFFPIVQHYYNLIKSGDTIIEFFIEKNGDITNISVIKKHGYKIIDDSALNAIKYVNNAGPLPETLYNKAPLKIHFRFVYIK